MKNNPAQTRQIAHRFPLMVCLAAFAMAYTVSRPQPIDAHDYLEPPKVPDELEVPAGNKAFLEGHAVGTQDYICLPSGSGFAWTFFGPQATLFNDHDKQIITHFLSPNPDENGTAQATWQHSRDTSTIWAVKIAESSNPNFVASGAIPWFLLQVVGAQDGPTGGDKLSETTFIQRLNTFEGMAPSTGCTLSTDVGKKMLVSYTADYFFYKATKRE